MNIIKIKYAEKGLSLIELLIAMVIGLFLLSGIASSYLSSKQASVKRDQISVLEDNGRLALEIISKSLEHTGNAPSPGLYIDKPFILNPAGVVSNTCADGTQSVISAPGTIGVTADNDALGQDTIGVVFHGDDDLFTDCAGGVMPAVAPVGCRLRSLPNQNLMPDSSKIYNSLFIDNVNKTLECAGSRSAAAVTIAEGVENMQFLYGIDVDNDNNNTIERYVTATAINADTTDDLDWVSVKSIKVAILVRSLKSVKNKAETKRFTLLDTVVTTPNDRYRRAVFSTTIHLRNIL